MEGGVIPPDWEDFITKEGWAVMSEEGKQAILGIISEEQEYRRRFSSVGGGSPNLPIRRQFNGPAESHGRHFAEAGKRKSDDGCDIVGNENAKAKMINPPRVMDMSIADDSILLSRDIRQSDTLVWLRNYEVHFSEKKAPLGPMRHTYCEFKERCLHYPNPMLQILNVFVKCYYMHDDIAGTYYDVMPDNTFCPDMKMDVYGIVAIRDPLDDSRNYIFNRQRESAQTINADGGYLCLRNPARGISAINCLIEMNIKIKVDDIEDDCTIVDGCVKAVGQFTQWSMNHVDSMNGRVTLQSCVTSEGVEATIQLYFIEVPTDGFQMQMSGNTILSKCFYPFISEHRRDCDGFVASVGKHGQNFIAAVNIGDTLCIDFMEKGRDSLSFVGSNHGNEKQLYQFCNGAVVSVQVYWSTIETVQLVEKNVTE